MIRMIFQFHKGAIRTNASDVEVVRKPNFNSIKVRLELNREFVCSEKLSSFQFHKGAIRTR